MMYRTVSRPMLPKVKKIKTSFAMWLAPLAFCMASGCASTQSYRLGAKRDLKALQPMQAKVWRGQIYRGSVAMAGAELRAVYLRGDERLRVLGQLVVAEKRGLRVEIRGPHGGTVFAAATDQKKVDIVDFLQKTYRSFLKPPAWLGALLGVPQMAVDSDIVLQALLGRFVPPAHARLYGDAQSGVYVARWRDLSLLYEARYQGSRALLDGITVWEGGDVRWDIHITQKDDAGRPLRLELLDTRADAKMRIRFLDWTPMENLAPDVFRIAKPQGFAAVVP